MADIVRARIVPLSLVRISGPAAEVATLDQARLHCRLPEIADPEEDARVVGLLERYISAAREYIEAATGRTFYRSTWEAVLPAGRRLALPRATPLREIVFARWRPDVWTAWDDLSEGAEYVADVTAVPGAIECVRHDGELLVRYVAGRDAEDAIEDTAIQAVLLMTGALWENREAESVTDRSAVTAIMFRHGLDALIKVLQVQS